MHARKVLQRTFEKFLPLIDSVHCPIQDGPETSSNIPQMLFVFYPKI